MDWEDMKDKSDCSMRCALCDAPALISKRTGQPYCKNFMRHKEEGYVRNMITMMKENEMNFFANMLEDGECPQIDDYKKSKHYKDKV